MGIRHTSEEPSGAHPRGAKFPDVPLDEMQTVSVGRVRMATRRWLVEWFATIDSARREHRRGEA